MPFTTVDTFNMTESHVDDGGGVLHTQTFQCSICRCQHPEFAAIHVHVLESNSQETRFHCPGCGASACVMLQLSNSAGHGHLYTCRQFLEANGGPDNIDYGDLTHYCKDLVGNGGLEQAAIQSIPVEAPRQSPRPTAPATALQSVADSTNPDNQGKRPKGKRKISAVADHSIYTCSACQLTSEHQDTIKQHVEAFNKEQIAYACPGPGCGFFACTCLQLVRDHLPFCHGFFEWKQHQGMSDEHLTSNCRAIFGQQVQATAEIQVALEDSSIGESRTLKARRQEPSSFDRIQHDLQATGPTGAQRFLFQQPLVNPTPGPNGAKAYAGAFSHPQGVNAPQNLPSDPYQVTNTAQRNNSARSTQHYRPGNDLSRHPLDPPADVLASIHGVHPSNARKQPSMSSAQSFFDPLVSQMLRPKYQPAPSQTGFHQPSEHAHYPVIPSKETQADKPLEDRASKSDSQDLKSLSVGMKHAKQSRHADTKESHTGHTTSDPENGREVIPMKEPLNSNAARSDAERVPLRKREDCVQDNVQDIRNEQAQQMPKNTTSVSPPPDGDYIPATSDDGAPNSTAVPQTKSENVESLNVQAQNERGAISALPNPTTRAYADEAAATKDEPSIQPSGIADFSRESTEEAPSPPRSGDLAPASTHSAEYLTSGDSFDDSFPRIYVHDRNQLLFPTCGEYLKAAKVANPKGITDLNDPDSWLEPLNDEDSIDWRSTLRWCKSCSWGVEMDDAGSHRPGCIIARKFKYNEEGNLVLDE